MCGVLKVLPDADYQRFHVKKDFSDETLSSTVLRVRTIRSELYPRVDMNPTRTFMKWYSFWFVFWSCL